MNTSLNTGDLLVILIVVIATGVVLGAYLCDRFDSLERKLKLDKKQEEK